MSIDTPQILSRPPPVKHVVMYSGGIGSWAAAKRVIDRHGSDNIVLLFTDTLIEDADLYRFLDETSAQFGIPITRVAEGRTPWQVFRDEKMMGNTRADLCSRILKREVGDQWLKDNCDPASTIVYLGIDWTEDHRFDDGSGHGAKHRYARSGWTCEAPMTEKPLVDKNQMKEMLKAEGINLPRLYTMNFAHNNCGGFCIKAGQGHFANLYRHLPQRYAEHEHEEQKFRADFDSEHAILRDRRGGVTTPLTLRDLRIRLQNAGQVDMFDIGGCGCFVND